MSAKERPSASTFIFIMFNQGYFNPFVNTNTTANRQGSRGRGRGGNIGATNQQARGPSQADVATIQRLAQQGLLNDVVQGAMAPAAGGRGAVNQGFNPAIGMAGSGVGRGRGRGAAAAVLPPAQQQPQQQPAAQQQQQQPLEPLGRTGKRTQRQREEAARNPDGLNLIGQEVVKRVRAFRPSYKEALLNHGLQRMDAKLAARVASIEVILNDEARCRLVAHTLTKAIGKSRPVVPLSVKNTLLRELKRVAALWFTTTYIAPGEVGHAKNFSNEELMYVESVYKTLDSTLLNFAVLSRVLGLSLVSHEKTAGMSASLRAAKEAHLTWQRAFDAFKAITSTVETQIKSSLTRCQLVYNQLQNTPEAEQPAVLDYERSVNGELPHADFRPALLIEELTKAYNSLNLGESFLVRPEHEHADGEEEEEVNDLPDDFAVIAQAQNRPASAAASSSSPFGGPNVASV